MNRSHFFRTLAASTLTLLAACDGTPVHPVVADPGPLRATSTAGAERQVEEHLYDVEGSHFRFACDAAGDPLEPDEGELVALEGKVYERLVLTRTPSGGVHTTWNTMPVGLRGVGLDSGEEFRVVERSHGGANQTEAGISGSYRSELKLVGRDTHRTFVMVTSGSYRLDGAGEVVVTRERERVACRS